MLNEYKTFGVTVRGKSHVAENIPNQDCFLCHEGLIVVSDGVGSAELSHIGSEAAVNAAAESFAASATSGMDDPLKFARQLHEHWNKRINPQMIRKYAATCLFAAIVNNKLLLGRLGDGIIAVLCKDAACDFICEDDKSDSYANMTDALRGVFQPELWETYTVPVKDVVAVIICTDGITDRLRDDKKLAFFRHIFKIAQSCPSGELSGWAEEWVGEWYSESGDDKTVAFLLNKEFSYEARNKLYRRIQQKALYNRAFRRGRLRKSVSHKRRKDSYKTTLFARRRRYGRF